MTVEVSTIFLFIGIAIIIISDIPLALDKTNGNTWSEIIKNLSLGKLPSIPFCCGFVCGHWFMWKIFNTPFWITAIIILANIVMIQTIRFIIKKPFNKYAILILFIIGFVNGGLFWGI